MEPHPHDTPPAEILRANLDALRQHDPQLAEKLTAHHRSLADWQPALGRDGIPTFCRRTGEHALQWLGRTSVPGVRAEATVERFDPGTGNVFLPGLGQGYAAELLLGRLGPHRAVFAWEPDAEMIALALCLYRWSRPIEAGRLVLLNSDADHLAVELTNWLKRHPGHLCPNRIMMWPWLSPPELAACRGAVQTAWQQIEAYRQQELTRQPLQASAGPKVEASARRSQPTAFAPASVFAVGQRVGCFCLHAREEAWVLMDNVTAGLRERGCVPVVIDVRRPGDVHVLARRQRLRAEAPEGLDLALLLDTTRPEVGDILDASVPALAWLGPRSLTKANLSAQFEQNDPIIATAQRVADRLVAGGISAERIAICPHPHLLIADKAEALLAEEPRADRRPVDAVLFADWPSTDPKSLGYVLPSHRQLFNTALRELKKRSDRYIAADAESLLSRAERDSGIRLEDARVRQSMISALADHVGNAIVRLAVVDALREAGLTIRVWGSGWPDRLGAIHAGPLPSLAERPSLLVESQAYIDIDVTGHIDDNLLLAAACGTLVLHRRHPTDEPAGGSPPATPLGNAWLLFRSSSDAVTTIRQITADADKRASIQGAARRKMQSDYAPGRILEALATAASSCFGLSRP